MKLLSYSYEYSVGTSYNLAAFSGNISKLKPTESLEISMERLGGEFQPDLTTEKSVVWKFPNHIPSQVIEEVIRNTCFECGGLMKDNQALVNISISFNDFGRDAGSRGTTMSRQGPAVIKNCRKCISCGHSHF